METLKQHKILVIIAILVVVLIAWYILSGSSGDSASKSVITTTTPTDAADRELVSTLLALRSVKLDGTIFSEPAFASLKDFSTQIISEPVGRPNPFAPLSAAASSSADSVHAAKLFTPR